MESIEVHLRLRSPRHIVTACLMAILYKCVQGKPHRADKNEPLFRPSIATVQVFRDSLFEQWIYGCESVWVLYAQILRKDL